MCRKSDGRLCILTPLCTGWEPMDLSVNALCLSFLICAKLVVEMPTHSVGMK